MSADVATAIKRFIKQNTHFDLIYIDPPYSLPIEPILNEIAQILNPQGLVILEQSKKTQIEVDNLELIDERSYGDTVVYFYSKR